MISSGANYVISDGDKIAILEEEQKFYGQYVKDPSVQDVKKSIYTPQEIHVFDVENVNSDYFFTVWIVINSKKDSKLNLFDSKTYTLPVKLPAVYTEGKTKCNFGVSLFFNSKKNMTYKTIAKESAVAAKYLFSNKLGGSLHEEQFGHVVEQIAEHCCKVKNNQSNFSLDVKEAHKYNGLFRYCKY